MALITQDGVTYDNSLPADQWQTVKTSDGRTIQVNSQGKINFADPASKEAFRAHAQSQLDSSSPGSNPVQGAVKGAYDLYMDKTTQANQPGVGGPVNPNDPAAAARLQKDPATGMYMDPSTGTVYTDATGQVPVTNPNVAQQVSANFATSRDFLGRARAGDAEHAQTFGQQTQLSGQFQDTIDGKTPSVAQTMLGQATDATNRRQLSAAAGVGGANAFAARRQALQNISGQNAQADQGASVLRAKEINDAMNSKVNLLGQMSAGTDRRYATDLNGAQDFGALAEGGQEKQQGLNTEADKDQKRGNRNILSAVGNIFNPGA